MTVQLDVAIAHAPWDAQRRAWVLAERQALYPLVPLIVQDHSRQGCWPTTRRAWKGLLARSGASHLLVLSDDMGLCDDFVATVERLCELRPDSPLVLHCGRPALVADVKAAGGHWAQSRGFAWGGVTVLPRAIADGWLRWLREPGVEELFLRECPQGDDDRLRAYLHRQDVVSYVPLPSPLADVSAGRSLMGHGAAKGHDPAWFQQDSSGVDWAAGFDDPVKTPSYRGAGERRACDALGIK